MRDQGSQPTVDNLLRAVDEALEAHESELLLGASLRGDREALTDALIARIVRRDDGSLHGARVEWLLRLLHDEPFRWSTFPVDVLQDVSEEALEAMIFSAASIAYGYLAASPSRAS